MSKTNFFLITTLMIPLIISSGFVNPSQVEIQVPIDVNILSLIANGVGNTYFTVIDQFEKWGWNVTTAGLSDNHTGCPNKDPILVTSDILVSEINNVSHYDCIFIASGAQHKLLRIRQSVLDLIKTAYNEGLIISTLCASTVILADAGIINDTKVTGHSIYKTEVEAAGGIFDLNVKVVSDKRVVTGAVGGGPYGGGDLTAPTFELCVAIAREILGISYIQSTSVTYSSEVFETKYVLKVETTNLTNLPLDMSAPKISQISAHIYQTNNNLTFVKVVQLTYNNNIYIGSFKGLEVGNYTVNIEIIDEEACIEVVRNATSFSIDSTTSSPVLIISLALISAFAIVISFLIFYLIRRRKS